MNTRKLLLGFVSLIAFGTSVVPAAVTATTFTVTVGNGGSGMSFSPTLTTINVGDSVTFNHPASSIPHNVNADDGSFKCAKGCDGQGGSSLPTGVAWSDTIAFSKAGSFGFYCSEHGGPGGIGMAGTIKVNSVAPPPTTPIGPGFSGNWFNPTSGQDGHGFQLEILPGNGILAIWFVFTPDGTGQTWLYSQGGYDPTSNTVTLPSYLSLGAKFPPNFQHSDDHVTQWGTVTFAFTDCNNGTFSWTSTTAGYAPSGSFPIQRVTSIAGLSCP